MSVTKSSSYKFLSSLKLTIFLLSFIAVTSILGTLIKQKAGIDEYLSVYSESTYRIIRFFSLDDAYHSPWFLAAIILFTINLTFCMFDRFSRFLKATKEIPALPDERTLSAMQMHFFVETIPAADALKTLKAGYKSAHEEDGGTVLEKSVIARYGVYIIHSSILIILIGSLVGLIFGYKGFIILNIGETKGSITMRGGKVKEMPLGFSLKCNDFKVSFYPGGEPKDYMSKLEVVEKGKVVMEKEIRVNDPLNYKGIHVYQASYGAIPSFLFNIGGKNVVLKEGETYKDNNLTLMVGEFNNAVHGFGPGVLVTYLDQGAQKTVWFLKNVERLKEQDIQGVKIRLEEIKEDYYTGLEVAKDPGVWIVWAGFALILFGLYVNFFMYYRRVYIRKVKNGIIIAGVAFRNKEAFKEEFEKLKRKVI